MQNERKSDAGLELTLSLIRLSLIVGFIYLLQSVLIPLLFAILFAISLFPVCRFLENKKISRAFASALAVFLAVIILGALIWFIVHQVAVIGSNGQEIQGRLMAILNTILEWVSKNFNVGKSDIYNKINEFSNKSLSNAGTYLSATFNSIGGVIAGAVIIPLFTFFLLYYRDFFREFFFHLFSSTDKNKIHRVLNDIYDVVQNYLLGLITVMGIVAALNTAGLWVIGVEYAWFFGTLASMLMLLPYIGIAIGSILPALFSLATQESPWNAVGVIAWFQVVQFLEGNLITPNIVGSKVSINPLMAMISLLLGGMMFGLPGLILALPLTAVLKVIFDANPSLKPFGFLIGEPESYHLKRFSGKIILKKWELLKKDKHKDPED